MRLLTIGEAMVELRPQPAGGVDATIAGDAFNTAARVAAAGSHEVVHAQDLGDDAWLPMFEHAFAARGVQHAGRIHPDRQNGLYVVSRADDGERRFGYHRAGSAAGATAAPGGVLTPELVGTADLVCITGVTVATSSDPQSLLAAVRDARLAVSLNIRDGLHRRSADGTLAPLTASAIATELAPFLAVAEIVAGSREEYALLDPDADPDRAARELLAGRHCRQVLVTDGSRPAVLRSHGATAHATPPVPPAGGDTAGAGDAFLGGFLQGVLDGASGTASLERAVAAGARAVAHAGALPAISRRSGSEANIVAARPARDRTADPTLP